MKPQEIAAQFLEALFGDEPDNGLICIWTLPGKHSRYFSNAENAAAYAASVGNAANVYFGVGLTPGGLTASQRVKAEEVVALGGLWVDIDVANPLAHSKSDRLPPTIEDARRILNECPMQPTIVVMSGYGLQAYWAFKEPWEIDNDVDRAQAAALSHAWTRTVAAIADRLGGWVMDATHDLARVMRLPGTFNVKDPDNPRPVRILEHHDSRRYNPPEDFEPYLIGSLDKFAVELERPVGALDVCLSPEPVVSKLKFDVLCEEEPKFRKAWERKRRDFKDQSFSSYDMALASYAVRAGWTDQEVTDIIIAFRQQHGEARDVKKAFRLDYISRTITAARKDSEGEIQRNGAISALEELNKGGKVDVEQYAPAATAHEQNPQGVVTVNPTPKDAAARSGKLRLISAALGVEVRALLRYDTDPPQYELILGPGKVKLGGVANLIRLGRLQEHIAAAVGVLIPGKVKKWESVAQALLDCAETVEVGSDGREDGIVRGWLTSYLQDYRPTDDEEGSVASRRPFRRDGYAYIFLDSLREWLAARGDKLKPNEIAYRLRANSVLAKILNVMVDGKRTTRQVYEVPEAIYSDECGCHEAPEKTGVSHATVQ